MDHCYTPFDLLYSFDTWHKKNFEVDFECVDEYGGNKHYPKRGRVLRCGRICGSSSGFHISLCYSLTPPQFKKGENVVKKL